MVTLGAGTRAVSLVGATYLEMIPGVPVALWITLYWAAKARGEHGLIHRRQVVRRIATDPKPRHSPDMNIHRLIIGLTLLSALAIAGYGSLSAHEPAPQTKTKPKDPRDASLTPGL